MKISRITSCTIALLLVSFSMAMAQTGVLDNTFYTGAGPNGAVRDMAIQPDGKVIIVGEFTEFDGVSRNRIARVETSGALDQSFDPGAGANFLIYAVEVLNDGKVMIGGAFTSYDGNMVNGVIRLNSDGTINSTFLANAGTGANDVVKDIAEQNDGMILVAGSFSQFGATTVSRVMRLFPDGTVDPSFNPGTGPDDSVESIALMSDGSIIIGGRFTNVAGLPRGRFAKLDPNGALNQTYATGSGANSHVLSVDVYPDDRVVIGGAFTSFDGSTRKRVARIGTSGTVDMAFMSSSSGANDSIFNVMVDASDRVVITGDVLDFNGTPVNRITRLLENGTYDATFDGFYGPSGRGYCLGLTADEKIMLGGDFTDYSFVRPYIVRIYDQTSPGMSLSLIDPNTGGTFEMGNTLLDITWTTTDFSTNHPVEISLYDCALGLPVATIANVLNTGQYQWNIPVGVATAGQYSIYLVMPTDNDNWDASDVCFDLIDPFPPADPPTPIITDQPICGSATLGLSSGPVAGIEWYWQGTTCGTSIDFNAFSPYLANVSGTYYLRAYSPSTGLWSTGCSSVDVTLGGLSDPIIQGTVTVGIDPCVNCKVYVFQYPGAPGQYWPKVDSVNTDGAGYYSISVPANADIVLQVRPETGGYSLVVPTYTGNVHKWSTAQHVITACDGVYQRDISVMTFPAPSGSCTFRGTVYIDLVQKVEEEDPIPLIDVVIERTPPGNVTDMVQTGDGIGATLGQFEFELVADDPSPYLIRVSVPGVPMQTPYTITVNPGDLLYQNLDYCISIDTSLVSPCSIVGAPEREESQRYDMSIMPNPSSGNFVLAADVNGPTQVVVTDMIGRDMYRAVLTGTGRVQYTMPLSHLPKGVYQISISGTKGTEYSRAVLE
jgi:uncharacterized delta-60 repeat protein